MAPECVKQKGNGFVVSQDEQYITQKADVWALGCILFELISGVPPFAANNGNNNKVFRQIIEMTPRFTDSFASFSAEALNFIRICLNKDVEKRPTSIELSYHPWL